MAEDGFSGKGFLWRWALCLVLVTFNLSGLSYYAWAFGGEGSLALKALAGIVLLIAYVFIVHATWESLSPIGVVLSIAFFAAVIWVMVDFGLLSLEHSLVITWIILIVVSTILAVGMSFSLVRRRVTGQIDVDDVDY